MNNKKKIILGSIIGIMIGLLISTTYAIFSYNKIGNNQELIAGDIYMHYNESNTLTLENAMPSSTYDSSKYFEFTIKGKNTNKKYNIVYDINLNYGDEIESKTRIEDRFLKFRLVEVINNEETELLNDKSYLSIDNKRIYVATINKETNNEITKTYRLYVWIDKNVVIGNTDYADYSIENWNNVYGSVKVSVTGDFSEKEIQTEPYLVLKKINLDSNWQAIRKKVTSIEFHSDGLEPEGYITSFDVTDETSSGDVTLYTVDDGLDDNTYKAVVVGDDVIYAPENSDGLFGLSKQLVTFNSKNFYVDNVNSMYWIFAFCEKLETIDSLKNWNVEKVENMKGLFMGCVNLEEVDLSNWRTSSLKNISQMFAMFNSNGSARLDSRLKKIILSNNFDTSKVEDMSSLLVNNTILSDYNFLKYINVDNTVNMQQMFTNNQLLSNTDLEYISNWNTSKVENMKFMFAFCTNLSNIDGLANWNVESVENMSSMFQSCINIEEIDLSNWKTTSLTNMSNMFGIWNSDGTARTDSKLKRIILSDKFDTSNVKNMNALFANNTLIEDYSFLEYFDTKNVTDMQQLFQSNDSLSNSDLNYMSNWDVSNVTGQFGMQLMFSGCINITDATALNDWNINPNTNFTNMFKGVPTHPEFTKVQGTWDTNGTFTPTV